MPLPPRPFSEYTPPPPPFPATFFRTFSTSESEAEVLVTTDTLGPSTRIGDG